MRRITALATFGIVTALGAVAQAGIITISSESDYQSANPGATSVTFTGHILGPVLADPNGDWAFGARGPEYIDVLGGIHDPLLIVFPWHSSNVLSTSAPSAIATLYLGRGVDSVGFSLVSPWGTTGREESRTLTVTDWAGNTLSWAADFNGDPTFFGFSSSAGIRSVQMSDYGDWTYYTGNMGITNFSYTPGQGNLDLSTIPPAVMPVPLPPAAWMGLAPIFIFALMELRRRRPARGPVM